MAWLFWIVIALLALAGEAVTTALVLASFALAALVVSPIALVAPVSAQIVVFGVLALVLLLVVRPFALRVLPIARSEEDRPRIGATGREAVVTELTDRNDGQIRIGRSEFWSARSLDEGTVIRPGVPVEVVRTDGLTALVRPLATRREIDGQAADPFGLSARELEVLDLMALGMTNAEIADRLFLSPRTVHHHVSHILNKIGVDSRVDAVREGIERGLVRRHEGST